MMLEDMVDAVARLLPHEDPARLRERVGRRLLYSEPSQDIGYVFSYLRNPASAWAERLRPTDDARFWEQLSHEEQLEEILITTIVAGFHIWVRPLLPAQTRRA